MNKKDKRHSGRKTVFIQDDNYPFQETFWDDWIDYRDGFRGNKDRTLIRAKGPGYGKRTINNQELKRNNNKLKKHYKIRKIKKKK